MGARAAQVEPPDRRAILRIPRNRAVEEQLVERQLALEDVALRETHLALDVPGRADLRVQDEVAKAGDIEREVGLTEGNIFQGELTFDQLLFNRPIPGYAQYRAPVRGMYLCGSSTHPGGGVMGAPGYNAAGAILRDLGRGQ